MGHRGLSASQHGEGGTRTLSACTAPPGGFSLPAGSCGGAGACREAAAGAEAAAQLQPEWRFVPGRLVASAAGAPPGGPHLPRPLSATPPFPPGLDTTKDPCQKVKCSRHKVCVAQGYQRAMCISRKKLEHR